MDFLETNWRHVFAESQGLLTWLLMFLGPWMERGCYWFQKVLLPERGVWSLTQRSFMEPSCWGRGAAEAGSVSNELSSKWSGCWEKYTGQTHQRGPAAAALWRQGNCAAVTSRHVQRGWSNPPPGLWELSARLALPFHTGSSQSYLVDSAPSCLASPPLLSFLLHLSPQMAEPPPSLSATYVDTSVLLPSPRRNPTWFLHLCPLPCPHCSCIFHCRLLSSLPPCWPVHSFPIGIVCPLHPCYGHVHQGFFLNAGSILQCNRCHCKEMQTDAFAGWGRGVVSQHGGGSPPARWTVARWKFFCSFFLMFCVGEKSLVAWCWLALEKTTHTDGSGKG